VHEQELKDGWAAFLSRYRWDYFLTVTFKSPRLPNHAQSTLLQIGRVIESRTAGRYFLGSELHVSRMLHVHGLLQAPHITDTSATRAVANRLWRSFREQFGRSQVRPVRSVEAVRDYCTKYCTKELTEWHMRL